MFQRESARSFSKKYLNNNFCVIGRDAGSFNCFLTLLRAERSQAVISVHDQGGVIWHVAKDEGVANQLKFVGKLAIIFEVLGLRKTVVILQSSKKSLLERLIARLHKKTYVLQDFRNDYKFGAGVSYLTAFEAVPSNRYERTQIYLIDDLRPALASRNNTKINDLSLLVIGARGLLDLESNLDYLREIIEVVSQGGLEVIYKPHPAERLNEKARAVLEELDVTVTEELPPASGWPKNIISPHSSLGYDIPEQVTMPDASRFNILHSFGKVYDDYIFSFQGFEPLWSNRARNFESQKEFLNSILKKE